MVWSLKSKRREIFLPGRRVVGRGDFPLETQMSRQHFEIDVERNRIFITDLESTHGTLINGSRLVPHARVELKGGHTIEVGKTKLVLTRVKATQGVLADALVLLGLSLLTLLQPTIAMGQAVDLPSLFILLGTLLIAVILAAVFWKILLRRRRWSKLRWLTYSCLVTVTSAVLNYGLLITADRHWLISDDIIESKIKYFCISQFQRAQCTDHLQLCPTCELRLDVHERQLIANRLKLSSPEMIRTPANQGSKLK